MKFVVVIPFFLYVIFVILMTGVLGSAVMFVLVTVGVVGFIYFLFRYPIETISNIVFWTLIYFVFHSWKVAAVIGVIVFFVMLSGKDKAPETKLIDDKTHEDDIAAQSKAD